MQTNYIAGPYTTNRAARRAVFAAARAGRVTALEIRALAGNDSPSYRNNKLSTVQRSLMDRGLSRRQARRLSHASNQLA